MLTKIDSVNAKATENALTSTNGMKTASQELATSNCTASYDLPWLVTEHPQGFESRTKRASYAAHIPDELWTLHRDLIEYIYLCMTLDELMYRMGKNYGFYATKRQYTLKLKEWGVRKYGLDREETEHAASAGHTPQFLDGGFSILRGFRCSEPLLQKDRQSKFAQLLRDEPQIAQSKTTETELVKMEVAADVFEAALMPQNAYELRRFALLRMGIIHGAQDNEFYICYHRLINLVKTAVTAAQVEEAIGLCKDARFSMQDTSFRTIAPLEALLPTSWITDKDDEHIKYKLTKMCPCDTRPLIATWILQSFEGAIARTLANASPMETSCELPVQHFMATRDAREGQVLYKDDGFPHRHHRARVLLFANLFLELERISSTTEAFTYLKTHYRFHHFGSAGLSHEVFEWCSIVLDQQDFETMVSSLDEDIWLRAPHARSREDAETKVLFCYLWSQMQLEDLPLQESFMYTGCSESCGCPLAISRAQMLSMVASLILNRCDLTSPCSKHNFTERARSSAKMVWEQPGLRTGLIFFNVFTSKLRKKMKGPSMEPHDALLEDFVQTFVGASIAYDFSANIKS